MVSNLTQKLNNYLKNERISKENFDDLKYIANLTDFNEKILDWFRYLQTFEVVGWRNKLVTKKICEILTDNKPIKFYALFCPSYKKGKDAVGFRTDDVGNTTRNGISKLNEIANATKAMGFNCESPEAIFFDIALEQPEKTVNMIEDLNKNILNFKKIIPSNIKFSLLSDKYPELKDIIGYSGVIIDPLPVDKIVLDRIIERGAKFYELFGWDEKKIITRSKVIASSEAVVGMFLRKDINNSIMVYTPTMLERAQVYSGKHQDNPLAIIFPKK
ncbi:MAG: hypothetical protein Q4E75_04700 [bacterium]|nr:hypothetical protein [bacterium]